MSFYNETVYPSLANLNQTQYVPQVKVPVTTGFQGTTASAAPLRAVTVPAFGSDGSQMLTKGMAPQQSGVLGYFFLSTAYPGSSNGACGMASRACGR